MNLPALTLDSFDHKAINRFKQRFNNLRLNSTGCRIWVGKQDGGGQGWSYGRVSVNGRWLRAHRVSYVIFNGPIPPGKMVCHRCDTPLCIEPSHLFLGTNQDNQRDAAAKGRSGARCGCENGFAKLTEEQAQAILDSSGTHIEAAQRFGVSYATVSMIRARKSWRHLSPARRVA